MKFCLFLCKYLTVTKFYIIYLIIWKIINIYNIKYIADTYYFFITEYEILFYSVDKGSYISK
jgi:hypothetical protein